MAGFQLMYFLKLEVENLRCFRGAQVLDGFFKGRHLTVW